MAEDLRSHPTIHRRCWLAAAAAALATIMPLEVSGQEIYPSRPVRLVMPYAAGGAGDVVTRIIATRLSARLNQQFVVENRPGAGGATGASQVAKSAPDGYTITFASIGFNLMNAMNPGLQFDPGKD